MKIMNRINLCVVLAVSILASAEAKPRPNVVLIVCDDLNDYITGIPGQTGHSQSLTPNVEKLARSGVAFRRAYSNNPVCAPSRSSFLTGIYPHTSGNLFWSKWYENDVLKNSNTLMEHFRNNGYHVAGTGKLMHHHWPESWSGGEYKNKTDYGPYWFNGEKRWSHPSVPEPFAGIGPIDGSFAPLGPKPDGVPENAGWKYGWGKEQPLDFSDSESRALTPDELNAAWAVKKIGEFGRQKGSDPFFLAVGFVRPHTPLHVPQEYFDRFPMDEINLPEIKENDAADTHYKDIFDPEQKGLRYYRTLLESYDGDKEQALKKFTQAYLACVAAVDDCIGQVVGAIDNSPLKDNTIIVVTSDHGWQMGQKEYLFKNSPWEESLRIPFIVRAPGIAKPGGIAEHPISLIDLYPTLVDLCGLEGDTSKNNRGAKLDGYSVRSFLEDPVSGKWEGPEGALSMIYGELNNSIPAGKDDDLESQVWTYRTERWRYIRYNDGVEELYDHENDPREWHNLAGNPEYASVKKKLNAFMPSQEEPGTRTKEAAGK
ncbi:Choline-sulfatase [Pontiella desulfatans]|uniref:Choline-sulfatase n=1 Tax=Pontiella desulfatans TaxID=2750659 RepID=A0A6C2TWF3_PONDE|nr:sulfatase [Pontiella desulfatans]SPS73642.1 sulfatase S1_7 [Kiritimatiellales bacterium]VGO11998.1 Choline-sulfatase [Pontiella desulfatans]